MVNCLPATTLYARFGSAEAPEWWALVLPLEACWRNGRRDGMGEWGVMTLPLKRRPLAASFGLC